ncbi:MAG: hypothetical protein LLG04_01955 [Parachlamydia sp.]|nr:hypothetical protein [Parachlamydia sp.]
MIDYQLQFRRQAHAYVLMFSIENMLRVSMHNAMVRKVGSVYFTEASFPEYEAKRLRGEGRSVNVVDMANDRKNIERRNGVWLGNDFSYFWYIDFTVLITMLEQFGGEYFDVIFRNTQAKRDIAYELEKVFPIRHAIAHCRYVSDAALSNLESLNALMKSGLDPLYLESFESLALNSVDGLVLAFNESCGAISETVAKGEVVNRPLMREFQSKFSALLSNEMSEACVQTFLDILRLLGDYNRLSRKPGKGSEINAFKDRTRIEEIMHDFFGSFEVKV